MVMQLFPVYANMWESSGVLTMAPDICIDYSQQILNQVINQSSDEYTCALLLLDICNAVQDDTRNLLSQRTIREELRDEVQGVVLFIQPIIIKCHYVLVLQTFEHTYFCKEARFMALLLDSPSESNFVPSHFDTLPPIKSLENCLERPSAKNVIKLQTPPHTHQSAATPHTTSQPPLYRPRKHQ